MSCFRCTGGLATALGSRCNVLYFLAVILSYLCVCVGAALREVDRGGVLLLVGKRGTEASTGKISRDRSADEPFLFWHFEFSLLVLFSVLFILG